MHPCIIYILLIMFGQWLWAQKPYEIHTIAFYNVENLFDALDDPKTNDDDRTPYGKDKWTENIYQKKLTNTAYVIQQIGSTVTNKPPVLIGLCEVENRKVLEDLVQQPSIEPYDYGIIHFESPDERGIDVALLYRKSSFVPEHFRKHLLYLYNSKKERDHTRDQLVVTGYLDGEQIHIIVNHWPSRSGGQARSAPYRLKAAKLNNQIIDSIKRLEPSAKIISMGDFNDDPTDDAFKKVLHTTAHKNNAFKKGLLFNPMEGLFKKGYGSSSFRDRWHMLDQIYMTHHWLRPSEHSWRYWKAGVFQPPFLITTTGKYKGYPFRSFSGGRFTNGYSDHFPVYVYVIRRPIP